MLHAQINNYVSADADAPRLLHVFALNSTTLILFANDH